MSFEKLSQNCSLSSEKDIYAKQAICNNKANYMHMFYPQVVFISKDWHRFGTETDRGSYHVTGVWNETSTACRFGVRYTKLLKSFQRKNYLVTVYMSLVAASKLLYKSNVCFPYSTVHLADGFIQSNLQLHSGYTFKYIINIIHYKYYAK